MVPLTIACLTMAVCLGLGTGAVFKLLPQWYPDRVGAVTGVVGAAGGLGGFFPPLVMAFVKAQTGSYAARVRADGGGGRDRLRRAHRGQPDVVAGRTGRPRTQARAELRDA